MKSITPIQILHEVICISICANALGKDMNPSLLLLVISIYWDLLLGDQSKGRKSLNLNQKYLTMPVVERLGN